MNNKPDIVEVTVETVEADYCTLEICEHGFAQIKFFWTGREVPFAVAHIGSDAITKMTAYLVENLKPQGAA